MSVNSKMQSSAHALFRIRSYFSLRTSVLDHPPFRKLSHNSIFRGHFPKPPIACCLLSNARRSGAPWKQIKVTRVKPPKILVSVTRRSSTKLRSMLSEAAKVHIKHKQVLAEQAAGSFLSFALFVLFCGIR